MSENTAYEKIVQWWKAQHITDDAKLAEVLNGHLIAFAYNSGKIENDKITYHDTREIFEHDGVTGYTGDLRTLYEIRNAKYATEYLLDAFKNKLPLDEKFIKEMQKRFTLNTYDTRQKQLDGRTGRMVLNYFLICHNHPPIIIHEEDRKAYFAALEAWDNRQELQPLIDFLQEQCIKTWEKKVQKKDAPKRPTSLKDYI